MSLGVFIYSWTYFVQSLDTVKYSFSICFHVFVHLSKLKSTFRPSHIDGNSFLTFSESYAPLLFSKDFYKKVKHLFVFYKRFFL